MKNEQSKNNRRTIDDIERAAWYARLAFGFCSENAIETPIAPKNVPEKTITEFYVMP